MKVGSAAQADDPPDLAYGASGFPTSDSAEFDARLRGRAFDKIKWTKRSRDPEASVMSSLASGRRTNRPLTHFSARSVRFHGGARSTVVATAMPTVIAE